MLVAEAEVATKTTTDVSMQDLPLQLTTDGATFVAAN